MPDPIIYDEHGFPSTILVERERPAPRQRSSHADSSHRRAPSFKLDAIGFIILGSVIAALFLAGVI